MSHTKNRMRPQVKANGLKDHQVAGLATFVTDRIRKQILIRLPEHLRQTVVVAIQDFLYKNDLLIDRRKSNEMNPEKRDPPPPPSTFSLDTATPKQKTLGEILYDAFEDRLSGCDEWSRSSEKFKKEYETAADAVREAVEAQQPMCQQSLWVDIKRQRDEWESRFRQAIALAEKEQKRSEDYAKERDTYMKSYNEVCQRRNELEQELSVVKSPREIPVENKTSQRDSLYVLIVREEVGDDFSVCSFMQPTVTQSQMSAIVNILSEQLADGIVNLSEFQNKKESLQ